MIIKSLSRKTASFGQLIDYFNRGNEAPVYVAWNLNIADLSDRDAVVSEFRRNAALLQRRKGGNYLYHEIVSFKYRPEIPLEKQIEALRDVTLKYLQSRGRELIGYGRIHLEQGHLHFHLMLSSNGLERGTRHRLTKTEFAAIQKRCEQYLHQRYPELRQPRVYSREGIRPGMRTRIREYEFQKRTGKKTNKQIVREQLDDLLTHAPSDNLEKHLRDHGFEIYRRGKSVGVIHGGRRYRLSTLGLMDAYEKARTRIPSKGDWQWEDPDAESLEWQREMEDFYRKLEEEGNHAGHDYEP